MYSSDNNHSYSTTEEIDLKEVFSTLMRYKKSVMYTTLAITLTAMVFTYFSTRVYEANLSLKIQVDAPNSRAGGEDFMNQALGMQSGNIDNEIAIIQSGSVIQNALSSMNLGTRYYEKKNLKTVELYKSTPFVVETQMVSEGLEGYKFHIASVDSGHYKLSVFPSLSMRIKSWLGLSSNQPIFTFSKILTYDALLSHPLFTMTVRKTAEFGQGNYFFTLSSDQSLGAFDPKTFKVSMAAEKASVLYLTYEDNVPQRGGEILQAIAASYLQQNIETKNASAAKTLSFIDKQLAGINEALQSSATNLENYKSSHIVIDLKDKGAMASQKLSDLESQMNELSMQESIMQNLASYIKNNKDAGIDVGSISLVQNSPLQLMIQKLQEAYTLQATLSVDYTEKHPSVIKINQQIATLRTNLLETIHSNVRGIGQRKTILNSIIQKNKSELEEIPSQEKALSHLNNSFMVNQKIYEFLLQKRAETAIIESSTVSESRIIDAASVGAEPIKPKSFLMILVGLVLGFILGVTQAFFRNYLANTIQTISDIEKHTTLPMYSVLPYFTDKKSLYKDALRVLLTKFEYGSHEAKPKILTFTSSIHGEGRVSTAIEFATIAAQSGKKVIILDMDMRAPSIHDKLNLPNAAGMTELLRGELTRIEVVRHTAVGGMDMISCGSTTDAVYELIMSENLKTLLSELKNQYDYVVMVSPPAGLVADALVLMRLSDLNLIVFKARYSKRDFIKNINRFVMEHGLQNVGIILNALELKDIRPWRKNKN